MWRVIKDDDNGLKRRYSVTQMFSDLGLPTFSTVIHKSDLIVVLTLIMISLSSMYFTFGNLFSVLYTIFVY